MITTITSILIALSLLLGGTGAAVYAAQDSVPGEFLYQLKLYGENLQLRMVDNEVDAIPITLRRVERRMEEAQALIQKGKPIPESLVEQLEENLDAALKAAAQVEDTELALEQIKESIARHIRDTDRIQSQTKVPEDVALLSMVRNMYQNRHEIVDDGLEDLFAYRWQYRHRINQTVDEELPDADESELLDEASLDDDPIDDDTGEEVTPKGNTYQGKNEDGDRGVGPEYQAPNDGTEDRGSGEQSQNSPDEGYDYGPGGAQWSEDSGETPYGQNEGGWGPGPGGEDTEEESPYGNGSGSGTDDSSGGDSGSGSGGDSSGGSGGKAP
jgi:uncharacterized membrane protein YgcG